MCYFRTNRNEKLSSFFLFFCSRSKKYWSSVKRKEWWMYFRRKNISFFKVIPGTHFSLSASECGNYYACSWCFFKIIAAENCEIWNMELWEKCSAIAEQYSLWFSVLKLFNCFPLASGIKISRVFFFSSSSCHFYLFLW